jgi:activator of HSP90 ATPase
MNHQDGGPPRRHVIAALALAGAATAGRAVAATDDERTSLHQEIDYSTSPQAIYDVLLDSARFAAVTGLAADISREVGGAVTMFGGRIVGRNIELVGGRRIVQAWRETVWEPGVYSLVKFELLAQGDGARVVLDHTGFSPGDFSHLYPGWPERYWDPLHRYLKA